MKKILFLMVALVAMIACDDLKQPSFTKAAIKSESFVSVRMKYPAEVEFDGDYRGCETGPNEYNVLQKFTAKNAFGVKSSYIYKINMLFKGGEWTEQSSWTYDKLIIEDLQTGEQYKFYSPDDK